MEFRSCSILFGCGGSVGPQVFIICSGFSSLVIFSILLDNTASLVLCMMFSIVSCGDYSLLATTCIDE